MNRFSQVVFGISLATLFIGMVLGNVWICAGAWLILWVAGVIQENRGRG